MLDYAIKPGWKAEVARPAGRLRDSHPTHWLRLVTPLEQLFFDLRPARFEDTRQPSDGDPVDAGCSLVAHHRTQCRFYVVWGTNRLHQMRCGCRAFGFGRRRDRFDLLQVRARGFTPARHRQGQLELVWRSRFCHETPPLPSPSLPPLLPPTPASRPPPPPTCPLLASPLPARPPPPAPLPKHTVPNSS